ncbi:MAG: hypothetical protein NVSMB32_15350 [Actinomycetota bacterium]
MTSETGAEQGSNQIALLPSYGVRAVNFVAGVDLGPLQEALASWTGRPIHLKGTDIVNKEALFEELIKQHILLEPVANWESFRQAFGGVIRGQGVPQALIWTDADQMLQGGLADLVDAIEFS